MLNIEELARNAELFDGYYALIRPLSMDGATADVWLALDTHTVTDNVDFAQIARLSDSEVEQLGLVVAIKIYRPQNALDIEGEQRFRKEYMIVFNCIHTNLIRPTYFSVFRDTPYLVLPYCKLGSSELLVGNLTEEKDIWKYLYDVSSGLDYLHNKKDIVHLDMKPANVLIVDQGNYAITDFGISTVYNTKTYSDNDEASGTTAYMAPERFKIDYKPSAASDIWALGATLFELIVGTVPYGEEGGAGQSVDNELPPFPSGIPHNIEQTIVSCLNQDPAKRPTAHQLMELSEKQLKYKSSDSTKEGIAQQRPKVKKLFVAGIAAVALVTGGLIALEMNKSENETSIEETEQVTVEPKEESAKPAPIPADVLKSITAGQAALERGNDFVQAHPDMINSENGLGEDFYIEALQYFSELKQMDAVQSDDSISRIVAEGIETSEKYLNLFVKELTKMSNSPLPMVSAPATKRLEKINEFLKSNQ